jgi:hypothetical protein
MSTNPLPRRTVAALAALGWLTACCLAVVVARSWKSSRKTASDMRVAFSAENNVVDQANKREQQRDAVLAKNLEAVSRAASSIKTPAEIAERLPSTFLSLPHPIAVSFAPVPQPDIAASSHPALPDAQFEPPALITVPQPDLKPMLDQLEACRACAERLAVAQQDLQDERAKVSALTAERDAAAKAALGGSFWRRLRLGAKWFLIGSAAGALAASAARR